AAVVEAGHGRRPVRRDEAESVPAVLPAAAQRRPALQQDVLAAGLAQQPAHDQPGVTRTDDDGLHRACPDTHSHRPRTIPALDRLPGPPPRTVVGYVADFNGVARATRPRQPASSPPTTGPSVDSPFPTRTTPDERFH